MTKKFKISKGPPGCVFRFPVSKITKGPPLVKILVKVFDQKMVFFTASTPNPKTILFCNVILPQKTSN